MSSHKRTGGVASFIAVVIALVILLGAGFVAYKGVGVFADGLTDFFVQFEEDYDGIKNG